MESNFLKNGAPFRSAGLLSRRCSISKFFFLGGAIFGNETDETTVELRGANTKLFFFNVLLTLHFITVFVNNQLDAQLFFLYLFIPILHMFRAIKCSSSGESTVSIRPPVYVTVCR